MEELYKKIIRGFYPQIPSRYSDDLKEIIQLMIQTEVGARPSCDELLKMSIILEKIEVINKNLIELNNNNNSEKKLLSTIRIPSEFSNFSKDLPKPKYYSPSQSERDINKKRFEVSNLYNCSDKRNDTKEQSLVEDKKDKKNLINVNKNSMILSPLKIKDNNVLILSNDRKKKINKMSSLLSPAIANSSSKKSMDKIILPEIKSNKNIRNYNSIEKSKILKIKTNNNNEIINSPYKVLKSESNVNSYNKNNYKYYLNIKIKNSNENQRLINNIKSLKENKILLNHNSNNNNILNRVLKHQYNIMLKNRKYNWEEKK
jgi:NIMA (never in mitosis gene a)-related kinase